MKCLKQSEIKWRKWEKELEIKEIFLMKFQKIEIRWKPTQKRWKPETMN